MGGGSAVGGTSGGSETTVAIGGASSVGGTSASTETTALTGGASSVGGTSAITSATIPAARAKAPARHKVSFGPEFPTCIDIDTGTRWQTELFQCRLT